MVSRLFKRYECELFTMSMDETPAVEFGQSIYDEDGNHLGTIRGFDENGFYVTALDDIELLDDEPGGVQAEALMWRCWECGEMGKLGEIPEECPACGAPKEEIYYWQED